MTSGLPLEGIRVLELTTMWAGPYAGRVLASMGAEVIKIQRTESRMAARNAASGDNATPAYVRGGFMIFCDSNKLGLTLDFKKTEGVEIFKKLVSVSDVVLENFSLRVMPGFGLHYEALREINPKIIMISMPASGMTGPESSYSGYGIGIEQLAGYVGLTGYSEDEPQKSGIHYADPVVGLTAGIAMLTALYSRAETGKGQHIDLSHWEAATSLIGDVAMDYSMNRRVQKPRGNRDGSMAPHGCYRCSGEDEWVTIAVGSDEEWRNFCCAIGKPELLTDTRFSDTLSRFHHQDELDFIIGAWTSKRGHYEVMQILQNVGVAAGPVLNVAEVLTDPHMRARNSFQWVPYPDLTFPVCVPPWRSHGLTRDTERECPDFGEHNEKILMEVLGMTQVEIDSLLEKQVIAKVPIPQAAPR